MRNAYSKRSVIDGINSAKTSGTQVWRDNLPTWCPGCGHFAALHGLYESLNILKVSPKDTVLVSGIGCSGRFPFFSKGFGLHALHGRAIPVATGVKIANPELCVVVVGGDGDGVGIGGGHFPHAARNNLDLTYILLDNSIYGLTKGQISPTSPVGMVSATSPYGNIAHPLNPTTLALAYGATFVARVFSRERQFVSEIVTQAIRHQGFSMVHVLSPCVEFNKQITYTSWQETVARLPDDYHPDDRNDAMKLAESKHPIHLGVFFESNIPTFEEEMKRIQQKARQG
ncbi:2-oxoacid:ferredoxin oxidoreductase subunit beta [candidate division KSB1 bacterium]|nr:2-oxoacid:ferredoxin oxidoreductase subunit beta [candidate division KSB1 bacterium]